MIIHKNITTNDHAKQRAAERYESEADELLVNGILSRIWSGKGKLLKCESKRKIYQVKYRKSYIVVVSVW